MKNRYIYVLLVVYAVIALLTIIFFDGTGDAGDSIHHYQFARYAPLHIELFFDHWAKPFFVLLASPFAQLGFVGIKIFNVIVTFFSLFFTFKVLQKLNVNNAIVGAIFLMFSPLCFVLTFSGLTEPLFGLFLIMSLYALLEDKGILASILISFLPFIRSEGLIFLGVFGFYFLLKKQWKLIPLLLVGHVAYMFAGYFVYKDLLWVFNKIPYAKLSSTYGSGKLFHFVDQLQYVIGIPIYILLGLGILSVIYKSIQRKVVLEVQVIVFLGFFAFFIAHSLFWYLGIFNSMGLNRVFIGVAPFMAIIAVYGYNLITEELTKNKKPIRIALQSIILLLVLIFPFTSSPSAIDWKRDLSLSQDQKSAVLVAEFLEDYKSDKQKYFLTHPYLCEALDIDYFDKTINENLINYKWSMKPGDLLIWDAWFSVVENGVQKEELDNTEDLEKLYDHSVTDGHRTIHYAVYLKK